MKKINGIIYFSTPKEAEKYKNDDEKIMYNYCKHLYFLIKIKKECPRCGKEKELKYFCSDRNLCKDCHNKANRDYYNRNKEKIKIKKKKKYDENAEHYREISLRYRNKNIEACRKSHRVYYNKNREKLLANEKLKRLIVKPNEEELGILLEEKRKEILKNL